MKRLIGFIPVAVSRVAIADATADTAFGPNLEFQCIGVFSSTSLPDHPGDDRALMGELENIDYSPAADVFRNASDY